MKYVGMTTLAQERLPDGQQTRLCRTVRIMAGGAILGHRLMFPQEWTALFRVALRAGFHHAGFAQQ